MKADSRVTRPVPAPPAPPPDSVRGWIAKHVGLSIDAGEVLEAYDDARAAELRAHQALCGAVRDVVALLEPLDCPKAEPSSSP